MNTKVAVIKDNRRNFGYCLYVGAVADPDLQIREGGGHPDPEIREEPGLQKIFLGALRASVWSKGKGGPSPGSTTDWCPS